MPWYLLAMAEKSLFLRNQGDEKFPNLRTEKVFEDENPPSHEQGIDRPGRVAESAATGRRSAVEPTDWHQIEEHRFARRVAAAIEQMVHASKAQALIVVAPPRTLAGLARRIPCRMSKHASSPGFTRTRPSIRSGKLKGIL